MPYVNFLKEIWNSIYDPGSDLIETINRFFHPEYEQCINGVHMNRAEYIEHVIEQKKNMIVETIDYKNVLEKENELFAIYYPRGRNVDNSPIEAEVIAYFQFTNQQIYRIHGQVRLIKGDLADVDMKNS